MRDCRLHAARKESSPTRGRGHWYQLSKERHRSIWDLADSVEREIAMHGISHRSFEMTLPGGYILHHAASQSVPTRTVIYHPNLPREREMPPFDRVGSQWPIVTSYPAFEEAVAGLRIGMQYFNPRFCQPEQSTAPAPVKHSTK